MFKNIEPDTRIELEFPITALVGINGTNKSSILRALQGAPGQSNLGNYWFSTAIDPIVESKDGRQCFIYGYHNDKEDKVVEVLKTRIRKEGDPDYWEPSRPVSKYGMQEFEKTVEDSSSSKTRWDNITKEVVYIDFRQSLSAFDKYFYQNTKESPREKKAHIRKCAQHLAAAIHSKSKSYVYYKERIVNKENRRLSDAETDAISTIVGKKYKDIYLVNHSFFKGDGYTAVMSVDGLNYTEAFAGSGEFAVVNLVAKIFAAKDRSLILLDEPEVSLHPGAQSKLMEFISRRVLRYHHQIIISTHAPAIVRNLPPAAIKVFAPDPRSQKVKLIAQHAAPEEAFFYIGEPRGGRWLVVVEDVLARKIVLKALRILGEALYYSFEVKYFPGGSKTLWNHYLPIFAAEDRKDVIVMFDGDERPTEALPDPVDVPASQDNELKKMLEIVTGVEIRFNVDGGIAGKNLDQENEMRRTFIKWVRKHVDYLPGNSKPEDFVWENMRRDGIADPFERQTTDAKARFEKLARHQLGREDFEAVTSNEILATQERAVSTIPNSNSDIKKLADRLRKLVERP